MTPKLPRNTGSGQVYITEKKVPPTTIRIDGTSINGATPPPEIIAPRIMPMAPMNPMRDAISISAMPFY
jgi:hypothetical protein